MTILSKTTFHILAGAALVVFGSGNAHATLIGAFGSNSGFSLLNNGPDVNNELAAITPVSGSWTGIGGPSSAAAHMTFTLDPVTTTHATGSCSSGGCNQAGYSVGQFQIIRDSDSALLLGGSFSNLGTFSISGSSSALSFNVSSTGSNGNVHFVSDIGTYNSNEAFAFSSTGLTGMSIDGAGFLNPKSGNFSVTFSADNLDNSTPSTTTPEPTSFVLLGSALIGVGVVRRRRKPVV